jgi:hypothetical protein
MKYEIGDKVILLHSDEEAEVVEIINSQMVMVDTKGIRFPVYIDQIDFPYFKMFTAPKKKATSKLSAEMLPREKPTPKKPTLNGLFLHFTPVYEKDVFDDEIVEKLKLYLINENAEEYDFEYKYLLKDRMVFSLKNRIYPASEFYLHDIDFDEVSENPKFQFVFSLTHPDKKKINFFEVGLKVKGKQIFNRIEEIKANNEASFSWILLKEYPAKPPEEKIDLTPLQTIGYYDISKAAINLPPPLSVIDLHIEKINKRYFEMGNAEILQFQLDYFEKYLQSAMANHMPNLTVIHGVGEGVLREEIHQLLKGRRNVSSFVNQHHPSYGFGATEIRFTY